MSEMNDTENLTPPLISSEGETPTPPLISSETPTEGETPEAEAPAVEPEPFVPLTAEDIVLPEGFTAEPELQSKFLEALNNQDLSLKDRANALVALQAEVLAKASEASSTAWDNMQVEWREAVKADPVVGGDKMVDALASVNKLVTEFGSPELDQVFALTGAGNNVHMVKFLHTLSQKLTEGGFTQGQPANADKNAAQLLYPSMKG